MCSVFVAIEEFEEYPLILMTNRDEFLDRDAEPMHVWGGEGVLAGRDLRAGGTWFAVNNCAEFALVTNYRAPEYMKSGEVSRGELPLRALHDPDFSSWIKSAYSRLSGFNVLKWDGKTLSWFGFGEEFKEGNYSNGIHGLSNAEMNTPWPKVEKGKSWLKSVKNGEFSVEEAIAFLGDEELADPSELPKTGVSDELELKLSALNIQMEGYGTRVSTIMTTNKDGISRVIEYNRQTKERREFILKEGEFVRI